MSDNRYGNLLDNVMNKKADTTAIDAASRFRDAVIAREQAEVDKRNSMNRQREEKEIAEQERLAKQNDFINSMLQKTKDRADEANRQKKAEEKERERREQSRKAMENLNWTPKKISR